MRLAAALVIVTLIGCNAVSGADGLSVQNTKGAYKSVPKKTTTDSDEVDPAPSSKPTTTPTMPADGADDGADAGGTSVDAGGSTTTSSIAAVECGTTVCRGATPVCCDSAASAHCSTKGGCGDFFELQCDDAGDCAAGQVCCVNARAGTALCQTSCPVDTDAGQGLICKNDGQCPNDQECAYGAIDDNNEFISDSWFFCGPPQ